MSIAIIAACGAARTDESTSVLIHWFAPCRTRRFSSILIRKMIVTIDGPAGAGKSSAARALAQRLGFEFLDTGAMYRSVALAALRAGVSFADPAATVALLGRFRLEMPGGRVLLDGDDVTGIIRTQEVTNATGAAADSPLVRRRLVNLQREIAAGRNMVCEGRDQGTVVFPDAVCKFFLVADPEERARRRQRELEARGEAVDFAALLAAIAQRDRRDAARDLAPMRPADDAVVLDSTTQTLEQIVARMETECRCRFSRQ
jgi:cytidylate kinase